MHEESGITYDRLVQMTAPLISRPRALNYRLTRLKRKPSETAAQTIWEGQKAIARRYIDSAHRYGRITYLTTSRSDERLVFPGDPATSGGRHALKQEWTKDEARPNLDS